MNKKTLITVVGPTAIGKTEMAIGIAKQFKTEIISADSRQFYKEMKIGTAVPSINELSAIPHHFIQHKGIAEVYSVGAFEKDALCLLDELFKKYDIVVLVGGTGLYISAITNGLDEFPKIDAGLRNELNQILKEKGIQELQELLKLKDPEYFSRVDTENPHRLIRALEVCLATGKPYSSFLNKPKIARSFKTISFGLTAKRELIYDRINQRVDLMVKEGLLEEAKSLYAQRTLNALQTVGYKEIFKYFDGEYDLDFAISEIKKNTRRFAKRQLTWFKKDSTIIWFDPKIDLSERLAEIQKIIENDR